MADKQKPQIKDKEAHIAKVISYNLPISRKHSVEVAKFIKNKNLEKAKKLLEQALEHKIAIPYHRYNRDLGHKKGMASGRYPEKTIDHFIKLLHSLETNAEFKGLSTKNLVLTKIMVNKGPSTWHYGRKRRRKAKRAHIIIEAMEK